MAGKLLKLSLIALIIAHIGAGILVASDRSIIKGTIVNNKGVILKGVYIAISSPQFIGVKRVLTPKNGRYEFANLTPGSYKLLVDMPGFKTETAENIILNSGQTLIVNFKLDPADTEEAVSKARPKIFHEKELPTGVRLIDTPIIQHLPNSRRLADYLAFLPQLVFPNDEPSTTPSVFGAPTSSNVITQDGVNMSDARSGAEMFRINPGVIDEINIETGAVPVSSGNAQGAYIRVVTLSGSNKFGGSFAVTHTSRAFAKVLWTDQELEAMGGSRLIDPTRMSDLSLNLSGPVVQDFVWLFSNLHYRTSSNATPFAPWADPTGVAHGYFNLADRDFSGLFKLSSRWFDTLGVDFELNIGKVYQPHYSGDIAYNIPGESTRSLSELYGGIRLGVDYDLDLDTAVTGNLSYSRLKDRFILNGASTDLASYYDEGTGYYFGSGSYNLRDYNSHFDFNASIVRYQDFLPGIRHRLMGGVEYESANWTSAPWKSDPFTYYYLNGSPYLYGEAVSPSTGETVGEGLVGISTIGGTEDYASTGSAFRHVGVYVGDTLQLLKNRVNLSLALRFDRSEIDFNKVDKPESGSTLAITIGTDLVEELLGENPYSSFTQTAWNQAVTWNSFSPRLGLTIDLFGQGRTILSGSFSRLPQNLSFGYSSVFSSYPLYQQNYFYWYDEDGNGVVSSSDTFKLMSSDYRNYSSNYYKQSVNSDLRAPVLTEWTVGLEENPLSDFTISARYVDRAYSHLVGYVMYDPSTQAYWYDYSNSPSGWWIPYTTTVTSSVSGYADETVTVYARSQDAPNTFYQLTNLDGLKSTYKGLELSFKKRMSHNWQLAGSFVWSKARGTTDIASAWSGGTAMTVITPNSFTNMTSDSYLSTDRPFSIKLMGTYHLPWDFYLSAYYQAVGGSTWARTVTIMPSEAWCVANNAVYEPITVYLEDAGSRRYSSWKNLDMRLEKEFLKQGETKYSIAVDFFNLLGNKYTVINLNDGGIWYSDAPDSSSGTRVISGTYGSALLLRGTRYFQVSLKVNF